MQINSINNSAFFTKDKININYNSDKELNFEVISTDKNNLEYEVSISEEGYRLSELSDEEIKEIKNLTEISKEAKKISSNIKSAFDESIRDVGYTNIMENLASKYSESREYILDKYSGEEAEEWLNRLDEIYDDTVKDSFKSFFDYTNLFFLADMGSTTQMINQYLEKNPDDELCSKSCRAGVVFNISTENVGKYSIIGEMSEEYLAKSACELAKNARKYIAEGNSAPVTGEEKEAFGDYISKDSDGTLGNLSYGDLKAVSGMFECLDDLSGEMLSKEQWRTLYDRINNSAFSDEIKGVLSNMICGLAIDVESGYEDSEELDSEINDILEELEKARLGRKKEKAEGILSGEEKYKMYLNEAKQISSLFDRFNSLMSEKQNNLAGKESESGNEESNKTDYEDRMEEISNTLDDIFSIIAQKNKDALEDEEELTTLENASATDPTEVLL